MIPRREQFITDKYTQYSIKYAPIGSYSCTATRLLGLSSIYIYIIQFVELKFSLTIARIIKESLLLDSRGQ